MKLATVIRLVVVSLSTAVVAASNKKITYSVISLVPDNQTIGVIIKNSFYPLAKLNKASTLLHYGKAPVSTSGYKYALVKTSNNEIISSENFTRPSTKKSTLNEHYGRSWNSYKNLTKLPSILSPLPIINRIESDLHIENEIPTIHLFGNQSEIDYIHNNQMLDTDIQLNMTYISPNDVKKFKNVTVSISGMSSRSQDKLSYKIKIPKKEDLYDYRRIKLRAMATDVSYMRDNLGYAIVESVGLPSSKHSYTRVYINNQAIGLFGLVEHLKSTWVRNEFGNGSKKFSQGALYVADVNSGQGNTTQGQSSFEKRLEAPSDGGKSNGGDEEVSRVNATSSLSYLGDDISLYSAGQYSVKEDPSVGTANFTRIMDLTKFISEQPITPVDNSVIPLWEEKMDVVSFLRGLALEIVISNSDGYFGMANNYMLYDDIETERLLFSSQDLDLTMGIGMYSAELIHGGNYSNFPGFNVRALMPRMMQVPQFKQEFEALLVNYTKELVNPTILGPRIDQLYIMLSEDVTWDRSLTRVGQSVMGGNFGNNSAPTNGPSTNSTSADNSFGQEPAIDNNTIPTNGTFINSNSTEYSFEQSVYGPTTSNSMAITDWLSLRSSNLLTFFNETSA